MFKSHNFSEDSPKKIVIKNWHAFTKMVLRWIFINFKGVKVVTWPLPSSNFVEKVSICIKLLEEQTKQKADDIP